MAFTSYAEVRPWAKSIREAVLLRRMPPWFADPHYGKFSNDRSLHQKDIDTIIAWVDGGAKEGDAKLASPPLEVVEGWNIGAPDAVLEMPKDFQVPESGTLEYQYLIVPTGFTEDKWVSRIEVRPGNRAVVHHVIGFIREPGSKWLADARPGEFFVPRRGGNSEGRQGVPRNDTATEQASLFGSEYLIGWAPGTIPEIYRTGQAKLVKAGSDIVFQLHYTTNGKSALDRSKIGLVFSKEPPARRVVTLAANNTRFTVPAGATNHRVDARLTLRTGVTLLDLFPHMHLRGKGFEFRLVRPDSEPETLLRLSRYDFNWQLTYVLAQALELPKGAVIECSAWYDNSANNPANPDATKDVKWGPQSWEEMMIGFFNVVIDAKTDPALLREKKPSTD